MARPRKEQPATEVKVLSVEEIAGEDEQQEQDIPLVGDLSTPDDVVTLVLSNGNLTTVIREAFYLGKLGGKLTPKFLPRLKSPPFIIKIDLTPEAFEQYGRSEGVVEYDAETKYKDVVIRSVDPIKFVDAILEVGAKGGILAPKKVVQAGLTLIVPALIESNVEILNSPAINVLPSK